MKTSREFRMKARISDSKIVFQSESDAKNIISNFEGEDVLITLNKFRSKRSLAQNSYYWGVIIPTVQQYIFDNMGENYSKEDIHSFHLSRIAGVKVETKEFLGELIMSVDGKRTSDMDVEQFTEFVNKLQLFWSEKGCFIPESTDKDLLK